MPDNVQIATGDKLAADNVSEVQYLRVKLVDGTDNSTTVIPGGAGGIAADIRTAVDLTSVDFPLKRIHEGDAFTFQEVLFLGSAEIGSYLLTVTDNAKWPHFGYEIEGTFGFTAELYEGCEHSGGIALVSFNRNRNSGIAPSLILTDTYSAALVGGTRTVWQVAGSPTVAGNLFEGSKDDTEWILDQNVKYALKITSAAANNNVNVRFNWHEYTAE